MYSRNELSTHFTDERLQKQDVDFLQVISQRVLKQDVRSFRREAKRIFPFLTFLTPHFLVLEIRDIFRQMLKEFVCVLTSSTSLLFIPLLMSKSSGVSGLKVPQAPPNAGIAQICTTHSAPWSTVLLLFFPSIKTVSSSETRETSWVFRGKGSKKLIHSEAWMFISLQCVQKLWHILDEIS